MAVWKRWLLRNVTVANSSSLKYKSGFVGNTDNIGDLMV